MADTGERVLVYWCTGVLVYWCTGVLVFWCTGVLVYWCTGVLVPAPPATPDTVPLTQVR